MPVFVKIHDKYVNMWNVPICPFLSVPANFNNKYKILEDLFME